MPGIVGTAGLVASFYRFDSIFRPTDPVSEQQDKAPMVSSANHSEGVLQS